MMNVKSAIRLARKLLAKQQQPNTMPYIEIVPTTGDIMPPLPIEKGTRKIVIEVVTGGAKLSCY